MRFKVRILALFFLLAGFVGRTQTALDNARQNYEEIFRLIKYDSVEKLSGLINYPLVRFNPLPNINSPKEFISYYKVLFDDSLKQRIRKDGSKDVFEHNGDWGALNGNFWMDDDGKLICINYCSKQEEKNEQRLTQDIYRKMYHGIKPWKENIVVCKSKKLLIRVDDINGRDSLRYISWEINKSISDKPDIILYGKESDSGEWGSDYAFKNGDWEYIIERSYNGESDDDIGLFLRILKDGKEIEKERCIETK